MRTYYRIAEDLFIFIAAISIGIAGVFHICHYPGFFGGLITVGTLLKLCVVSLLFSIALSLLELTRKKS